MLNSSQLDKQIEYVMKVNILQEEQLKQICEEVRAILLEESNVPIIQTPCTIVGDIHGQFLDLLEMFEVGVFVSFEYVFISMLPAGHCPDTNFVFLGDYVDRGKHCVCHCTLFVVVFHIFRILD